MLPCKINQNFSNKLMLPCKITHVVKRFHMTGNVPQVTHELPTLGNIKNYKYSFKEKMGLSHMAWKNNEHRFYQAKQPP